MSIKSKERQRNRIKDSETHQIPCTHPNWKEWMWISEENVVQYVDEMNDSLMNKKRNTFPGRSDHVDLVSELYKERFFSRGNPLDALTDIFTGNIRGNVLADIVVDGLLQAGVNESGIRCFISLVKSKIKMIHHYVTHPQ